jgi:competence protein ComEC
MQKSWKLIIAVFCLLVALLFISIRESPEENLYLIACDVGQGDAILIVHGKNQILVDGGRGKKVIDCLSRHIPFWDRTIEMVILTHPDSDHYEGLIEVTRRYKVNYFLAHDLYNSSPGYQVLISQVGGGGMKLVHPVEGTKVRLGLMYLDIVYPDEDYLKQKLTLRAAVDDPNVLGDYDTKLGKNEFSIVAILSLGDFDALLTGDIGPAVSDLVAEKLRERTSENPIEYIKVPHHGSKNGLTEDLLVATRAKVGVISSGKNSYGHPHADVINLLSNAGVKILRTDQMGDVVVVTDGKKYWVRE